MQVTLFQCQCGQISNDAMIATVIIRTSYWLCKATTYSYDFEPWLYVAQLFVFRMYICKEGNCET